MEAPAESLLTFTKRCFHASTARTGSPLGWHVQATFRVALFSVDTLRAALLLDYINTHPCGRCKVGGGGRGKNISKIRETLPIILLKLVTSYACSFDVPKVKANKDWESSPSPVTLTSKRKSRIFRMKTLARNLEIQVIHMAFLAKIQQSLRSNEFQIKKRLKRLPHTKILLVT